MGEFLLHCFAVIICLCIGGEFLVRPGHFKTCGLVNDGSRHLFVRGGIRGNGKRGVWLCGECESDGEVVNYGEGDYGREEEYDYNREDAGLVGHVLYLWGREKAGGGAGCASHQIDVCGGGSVECLSVLI